MIAETAMRMTLEQPSTPLTLSRLGAELAADPTALYRHFRSRDELIRELGDRLFGEVLQQLEPADDWQGSLRNTAATIRRVLLRRPALAADLGVRFTGGPNERRGVELLTGILREAGFDEGIVGAHARAFGEFVLAEVVMGASLLAMSPEEQARELTLATSLYGPDVGAAPGGYEDATSLRILDVYIDGLQSQLERSRAHSASDKIQSERGER